MNNTYPHSKQAYFECAFRALEEEHRPPGGEIRRLAKDIDSPYSELRLTEKTDALVALHVGESAKAKAHDDMRWMAHKRISAAWALVSWVAISESVHGDAVIEALLDEIDPYREIRKSVSDHWFFYCKCGHLAEGADEQTPCPACKRVGCWTVAEEVA